MAEFDLEDALDTAQAAVDHAQYVRRHHRRRTDKRSKQRQQDIALAEGRIADAMAPLRSFLGGFLYRPQTEAAHENYTRVSEASRALQSERRKLWKMKQTKKEKP